MARAIWKGDISFGMVSIPIAILPVKNEKKLKFHLLDKRDNSRIHYQRVNDATGKNVGWDDIVKGYEIDKDNYVVIDEDEFKKASPDIFKTIDIEEFVNFSEIDSLYFDKPYYLVPTSKNKKAYVLLRESLKKSKKVGVAKVIIRTKESLSIILAHEDALILNLLSFKEDIVEEKELDLPSAKASSFKINDKEMKMALSLINEMTNKWQPEKYHNDYREALEQYIEKQINKPQKPKRKGAKSHANEDVVDFIALLKQSMKKKNMKPVMKKTKK